MNENASVIPMVVDASKHGERAYDIFSRMLKDRVVFLIGPVHDDSANLIVAQMLFLAHEDKDAPIKFYINSPGGSVTAGLSIYDTMRTIPNKVETVCLGQAASMGAFLLAAGDVRRSLPHSRIMIHQPSGGAQGQSTDIQIQAQEIQRLKAILTQELANNCGQPYEKVLADCERDKFMSAEESKAYGLIDEIIPFNPKVKAKSPKI